MQDVLVESLKKIRRTKVKKRRVIAILLVLSLIGSLDVFWWLKRPGLTLAGDADCGIVEHVHDDGCQSGKTPCELKKHTHDISCYSDDKADVETQLDWQKMFANYPYTKNLRSDLVGIAKTQQRLHPLRRVVRCTIHRLVCCVCFFLSALCRGRFK